MTYCYAHFPCVRAHSALPSHYPMARHSAFPTYRHSAYTGRSGILPHYTTPCALPPFVPHHAPPYLIPPPYRLLRALRVTPRTPACWHARQRAPAWGVRSTTIPQRTRVRARAVGAATSRLRARGGLRSSTTKRHCTTWLPRHRFTVPPVASWTAPRYTTTTFTPPPCAHFALTHTLPHYARTGETNQTRRACRTGFTRNIARTWWAYHTRAHTTLPPTRPTCTPPARHTTLVCTTTFAAHPGFMHRTYTCCTSPPHTTAHTTHPAHTPHTPHPPRTHTHAHTTHTPPLPTHCPPPPHTAAHAHATTCRLTDPCTHRWKI